MLLRSLMKEHFPLFTYAPTFTYAQSTFTYATVADLLSMVRFSATPAPVVCAFFVPDIISFKDSL